MKQFILLTIIGATFCNLAFGQNDGVIVTGFGENAQPRNASAVLEAFSNDQGFLAPRLTMAERNAIANPATSLLIFQTDNTPGYYYNSGIPATPVWERLMVPSSALSGSGTATQVAFWSGTNALSSDVNLFWDNPNDRLGIGTATPSDKLHINGGNIMLNDVAGQPAYQIRSYASGTSMWLISGSSTASQLVLGTAHDWDRAIAMDYTPGTTGAVSGVLTIGQISKNHANFTHGVTRFYTNGAEKLSIASDGDIALATKVALRSNDSWLRINPTNAFASGTYIAGFFRADGGIASGGLGSLGAGTINASDFINANSGFRVNNAAPNGQYLRGNGSTFVAAGIQASDVPTLNQNTTGTAAGFTGNLAGDVSGPQSATVVADDSHNHTELEMKPIYSWNAATAPDAFPKAIATSFVSANEGWPNYGSVLHMGTYPNDGGALQLYAPYAAAYGGTSLRYRLGQYNNAGWTAWKTIWDDTNDGAGSGMDADLLDGQNGSYYAPDNLGNHTATTTLAMGGHPVVGYGRLEPYGVGGNSGQATHAYSIFQEAGAWAHPYPDLRIAFHTGIKLGANSGYNGIRFYNDYDMSTQTFSVGDGDNNIRVYYDMATVGDIVSNQNYGKGLVGVYDSYRYQNVFAMGAAYRLAADGTTPGNLYGLAWTHSNAGGQSKAGLGHQLLAMSAGTTTAAMGNGFWTNYTSYMPFIYDTDNTGYYFDANSYSQTSSIYANSWFRAQGQSGFYFESYGGGWWMQDATWIRNYNNKQMYYNTNAGDNTDGIMLDQESATQDHALSSENDAWGLVGYSNRRWYAMYAFAGFGTSSLKFKTDVQELSDAEIDQSLADVNNIQSIHYKWNKSVWEKENGNFADSRHHDSSERPDPNYEVPSWLGFSVESLPAGIVDETGENYQYGAMIGLLIASTKALTKRTEVLADALGMDLDDARKAGSAQKNVSEFGSESTTGTETWIAFPEKFCKQLEGKIPTVVVTPSQSGAVISVKNKSTKGFTVQSESTQPMGFDWIAMAKVNVDLPPLTTAPSKPIQKTDIDAWYSDYLKNNSSLPNVEGDPAKESSMKTPPTPAVDTTPAPPREEPAPRPASEVEPQDGQRKN